MKKFLEHASVLKKKVDLPPDIDKFYFFFKGVPGMFGAIGISSTYPTALSIAEGKEKLGDHPTLVANCLYFFRDKPETQYQIMAQVVKDTKLIQQFIFNKDLLFYIASQEHLYEYLSTIWDQLFLENPLFLNAFVTGNPENFNISSPDGLSNLPEYNNRYNGYITRNRNEDYRLEEIFSLLNTIKPQTFESVMNSVLKNAHVFRYFFPTPVDSKNFISHLSQEGIQILNQLISSTLPKITMIEEHKKYYQILKEFKQDLTKTKKILDEKIEDSNAATANRQIAVMNAIHPEPLKSVLHTANTSPQPEFGADAMVEEFETFCSNQTATLTTETFVVEKNDNNKPLSFTPKVHQALPPLSSSETYNPFAPSTLVSEFENLQLNSAPENSMQDSTQQLLTVLRNNEDENLLDEEPGHIEGMNTLMKEEENNLSDIDDEEPGHIKGMNTLMKEEENNSSNSDDESMSQKGEESELSKNFPRNQTKKSKNSQENSNFFRMLATFSTVEEKTKITTDALKRLHMSTSMSRSKL